MSETITGFKGFDKDLKCRDYQYEVGKEFEEKGKIKACSNGFHFCENPFDVLGYYPPSTEKGSSRYCIVKGSGNIDRDGDDSKVACSKLHISAEIGLKGIIEAGVKFILDKVNWKDNKESNTGNYSAATNTGNYSAATNTGNYSAATNTGYQSAAEVTGKESIAIVTGKDSKAKGGIGCWIVLTERGEWDDNVYPIKEVKAVRVDGEIIKPDTYYKLIDGEVIPCE
jgi:hypothetical protein